MEKRPQRNKDGYLEVKISGESFVADQVCTFQVHSRKRVKGRLRPEGSKSITVENVSLADGLRIVRLGIEAFKTARSAA